MSMSIVESQLANSQKIAVFVSLNSIVNKYQTRDEKVNKKQ